MGRQWCEPTRLATEVTRRLNLKPQTCCLKGSSIATASAVDTPNGTKYVCLVCFRGLQQNHFQYLLFVSPDWNLQQSLPSISSPVPPTIYKLYLYILIYIQLYLSTEEEVRQPNTAHLYFKHLVNHTVSSQVHHACHFNNSSADRELRGATRLEACSKCGH